MSVELKPCPFCGGKPHSRTEIGLDGIGRFYWFECSTCRARSGEKFATETCPQFYEEVRDAWNRRTDLSQAAVAAALEAAAKEHDAEIVRLEAQIIENNKYLRLVGKSERSSSNDFCNTAIGHHRGSAVRLRDLIPQAQHNALAAHVAAEVARARAEDAVKMAFPADVLEFALKIGRAEWGQTDPKTATEHAADMASTVEKTAAYFGQTEPQSLNGLYIEGTGIVICHTGVSPNSPEIARILTGLWNMIYDTAQIGAKP